MQVIRSRRAAASGRYDLVVIGMGSGGTLAARFAARIGLRVAAIERDRVGGDCLWGGCVPSKTLLASARAAHAVRTAGQFGITAGEPQIDLADVWLRIKRVQDGIASGEDAPDSFVGEGVDVIFGTARVTAPDTVEVDTPGGIRQLRTRYVLVCTGSRPAVPDIDGLDGVPYLTSDSLFAADRPPSSLAVVGGGPQGVELSQAMARLGTPVTLIEVAPQLLPSEEPDLSRRLAAILERDGVVVRSGTAVRTVAAGVGGVRLTTSAGDVEADRLLVATGRVANVDGLGLEALGIDLDTRGVAVDGRSRTHVASIYVVGDAAAGRPRFTHAAAGDAVLAVRDMFFPGRALASVLVPWCVFTDPELAHVGLTSAEARSRFGEHRVSIHRHELVDNDRARADATTEGALILVSARKRIVGAHALGPAAGELIHELSLAIRFGFGLDELQRATRIYPTIATGISQILLERATRTAHRYRVVAKAGRLLG